MARAQSDRGVLSFVTSQRGIGAALCGAATLFAAEAASAADVTRNDAWNTYFANRFQSNGWWSADGAQTATLPGFGTVWQFGDTFLHPGGLGLNNTILVHDTGSAPPQLGSQHRYYAKRKDPGTGAISRIAITNSIDPNTISWLPSTVTGGVITTWFWPNGIFTDSSTSVIDQFVSAVGCVGSCRYSEPGHLTPTCCNTTTHVPVATPAECATTTSTPVCPPNSSPEACGYGNGACRIVDMRIKGVYSVASDTGLSSNPGAWTEPLFYPVPIYNPRQVPPKLDEMPSNPMDAPVRIEWGQAFVTEGANVYIFGIRHSSESHAQLPGWPSTVHVAKASLANVRNYSEWSFLQSDNTWSTTPPNNMNCGSTCSLKTLFGSDGADRKDRAPRQFSVNKISWKGQTRWVSVESHPLGDRDIVVRTATSLTASWTKAYGFDVGAVDSSGAPTTSFWSAFAHPELSSSTASTYSLLVSYWSPALSRLRFLNVPLHKIQPWCTAVGTPCAQ